MELAHQTGEGRRILVRGIVQGVGFRPWVHRVARKWSIAGTVHNDSTGVTIEAFAPREALEAFVRELESSPPPAAHIRALSWESIPFESGAGFAIIESRDAEERRVSIPPDIATCDDCVRELFDPGNRRYRYPFTNCTNCGPRFTITRDVPYDRPVTTMAPFVMCVACRREYDDVDDRRFHAQPNACPACGPRLRLVDGGARPLASPDDDAISHAARLLREGKIIAVKGLGGFHVAVLAEDEAAVRRLRERKRREEKPFAVMVRDLAAAETLAVLTPEERRLLTSPERPIVLAQRSSTARIADAVAPGNPLIGLLLPYTPLHHVLLADAGAALVMTSANLSDEPLAFRNDEALARLDGIADAFLLHDREIETRCDDSVARVIAGRPVLFRRSRSWVPRGIPLSVPVREPILATGGQLKNTFCIAVESTAFLGPHVGDLDDAATLAAFDESVERMERFLRVRPKVIAHDLHPSYASTAWARDAAASRQARTVPVQHHHAHIASAMADHGLAEPVLGLAFDGTGYGTDGTAWGAELLYVDAAGFRRLGTFRPLPLAGGDRAIRAPWRIALAMLDDAFGGADRCDLSDFALFRGIARDEIAIVRRMIASGVNAPLAHGLGRWFDAFGALGLGRPRAAFEGQLAMAWESAASGAPSLAYPWEISPGAEPWTVDLRSAVRTAASDVFRSTPPERISRRFHETVIEASAELVRRGLRDVGRVPVLLTGGCFQNARLTEGILRLLSPIADVRAHVSVPPGDGGLSLGQAVIAAGRLDGKGA